MEAHLSSRLSATLHGTAAALSVVGTALLLRALPMASGANAVAAVAIYGASLVLAFASSAVYNGNRRWPHSWVLASLDHCTIFVLIAGTYTPVGLIALRDRDGLGLVALEWGLAGLGILVRLFWIKRLHRLSIPLYLTMGWLGIFWVLPLMDAIGTAGLGLIVAGGLAYSLGILMYRWHSLSSHNVLWHVFVVIGALFHFWAIATYVLPLVAPGPGVT